MSTHRGISESLLGAALFGGPEDSPDSLLPDAWLALLFREHATPRMRQAVFRTCRGGRRLVLQTAPMVSLRLRAPTIRSEAQAPASGAALSLGQRLAAITARYRAGELARRAPRADNAARLEAARAALLVRGTQPTTLVLDCSCSYNESLNLSAVVDTLLSEAGQCITALQLRGSCHLYSPENTETSIAVTAFLASAAPHLPSLASLTLNFCPCILPSPAALPLLRRLCVETGSHDDEATAAMYRAITPYLPQLTGLAVSDDEHALPWDELFNGLKTAAALTHFTTSAGLCQGLARLLLKHCPVLQHVSVESVYLGGRDAGGGRDSENSGDGEWCVETLTLTRCSHGLVDMLAYLPRRAGAGKLTVVWGTRGYAPLDISVRRPEGLSQAVLQRLPDCILRSRSVTVSPDRSLSADSHAAALCAVLGQLNSLQIQGTTPEFKGWRLPAGAVLSQLSVAPNYDFKLSLDGPLTDWALSWAVQAAPHMHGLSVSGLTLQTDHYSDIPWLWKELTVQGVRMLDLVKMPRTKGRVRAVKGQQIILTPRVAQVVKGLTSRLKQISWGSITPARYAGAQESVLMFTLTCGDAESDASVLHAQLKVLRAVAVDNRTTLKHTKVVLEGWHLTHDVMKELQGLPHWPGFLDLSQCVWPLKASEYAALAQHIPTTYTQWHINTPSLAFPHLYSICVAINERRQGLGLRRLMLVWQGHKGKPAEIGEHVTMTLLRKYDV